MMTAAHQHHQQSAVTASKLPRSPQMSACRQEMLRAVAVLRRRHQTAVNDLERIRSRHGEHHSFTLAVAKSCEALLTEMEAQRRRVAMLDEQGWQKW